MIRFDCSSCGSSIQADEKNAGRRGRCPRCGQAFTIPAAEAAPPAPQEAVRPAQRPARAPAADPDAAPAARAAAPASRRALIVGGAVAAAVAAAVVVAVVAWPGKPGPSPSAGNADAARKADAGAAQALPTLPDGRYKPGTIRLATTILKTWQAPPGSEVLAISPDGRRIACAYRDGETTQVFVAGEAGDPGQAGPAASPSSRDRPPTQDVEREWVLFSPDSKHLAYVLVRDTEYDDADPRHCVVVFDGTESTRYRSAAQLTFSDDSRHFAYLAVNEACRTVAVVDGKEAQKGYVRIGRLGAPMAAWRKGERRTTPLRFSPGGARLAYAANRNDPRHGTGSGNPGVMEWTVVVDGVEGGTYSDVTDPVWSPDGKRIAYLAGRSTERYGPCASWCAVVDGVEGKTYPLIADGSLRFSPDGRRVVYVAAEKAEGPYFVVDNGVEGERYNYIWPESVRFTADGRLALEAAIGQEKAGSAVLDPSGGVLEIAGRRHTVVDGAVARDPLPPEPRETLVSPDGRRKVEVVSASGTSAAAPATDREGVIVLLDGAPVGGHPDVRHLCFSADGKHLAYLCPGTSGLVLVVDGIPLPYRLGGAFASLAFTGPDRLEALTVPDRNTYRTVELRLVAEEPPPPVQVAAEKSHPPDPQAAKAVQQLQQVAAAGAAIPQIGWVIKTRIPLVYAYYGDKAGALASLAEARDAMAMLLGSDFEPAVARLHLLEMVLDGQLRAGRRDEAARTADEVFAAVKGIENVEAPENVEYIHAAARCYARLRDGKGVRKAMALSPAAAGSSRSGFLARMLPVQIEAGDLQGAMETAKAFPEARARLCAYREIGSARESASDKTGAGQAYLAAVENAEGIQAGFAENAMIADALTGLCRCGLADRAGRLAAALAAKDARNDWIVRHTVRAQALLGDPDSAVATMKHVAERQEGRDPTPSVLWAQIGRAQWQKGDRAAAAGSFDRAIQVERGYDQPRSHTGRMDAIAAIRARAGDVEGVLKMIQGDPRLHYARARIAPAMARQGEAAEALRLLAPLKGRHDSGYAMAMEQVARIQLEQGDQEGALRTLAEAGPEEAARRSELVARGAAAGNLMDLLLRTMSVHEARIAPQLAQARLDAGDAAGAARILERGLEILTGAAGRRWGSMTLDIVRAMIAMGNKAAALEAIDLLEPPPPTGPVLEHDPFDPFPMIYAERKSPDAALAELRVACGDLPGALAAARKADDLGRKAEILAAIVEALTEPFAAGPERDGKRVAASAPAARPDELDDPLGLDNPILAPWEP